MARFFFLLTVMLFWLGTGLVHASSPYAATHAYFSSRTLDAQTVVVLLAGMVLLTFFAVYLAVNILQGKRKHH